LQKYDEAEDLNPLTAFLQYETEKTWTRALDWTAAMDRSAGIWRIWKKDEERETNDSCSTIEFISFRAQHQPLPPDFLLGNENSP